MKNKIAENFKSITILELPLLARVIHENSQSHEETLLKLECIDDLLSIMKMRSFMNRRGKNARGYREVVDGRIGKLENDINEL